MTAKVGESTVGTFSFPGNRAACVCLHGFTASAGQFRALGSRLAERGIASTGILLPGHGTSVEDLERTSWTDWTEAALAEFDRLHRDYEKVFVAGLSMGGILAAYVAARRPVAGLVTLAAPIWLADRKIPLLPVARMFMRYSPADTEEVRMGLAGKPPREAGDLTGPSERFPWVNYTRIPLRAVGQLLQLIRETRDLLPRITAPALIVQAKDDTTVKPKSAVYIYDHIGSTQKELVWIPEGGHVIVSGPAAEAVRAKVMAFIEAICGGCA